MKCVEMDSNHRTRMRRDLQSLVVATWLSTLNIRFQYKRTGTAKPNYESGIRTHVLRRMRPTIWPLIYLVFKMHHTIPSTEDRVVDAPTYRFFLTLNCLYYYNQQGLRIEWDSNPRTDTATGFQDQHLKPLGHLSINAESRNRTHNPLITNQVLCLLSYSSDLLENVLLVSVWAPLSYDLSIIDSCNYSETISLTLRTFRI